jgi:hypothetical protein
MPDILSAGELANLREDLGAMLPDRCVIIRTTEADDAYGGQTRSDAIVGSDIPILLAATRGRIQTGLSYSQLSGGSKLFQEADYQLTFPQATNILIGDLVTVTTQNNMQLRITAVVTGESREVVKQAGGEEIRGD